MESNSVESNSVSDARDDGISDAKENGVVVVVDRGPIQSHEQTREAISKIDHEENSSHGVSLPSQEPRTPEKSEEEGTKLVQDVCELGNRAIPETKLGLMEKVDESQTEERPATLQNEFAEADHENANENEDIQSRRSEGPLVISCNNGGCVNVGESGEDNGRLGEVAQVSSTKDLTPCENTLPPKPREDVPSESQGSDPNTSRGDVLMESTEEKNEQMNSNGSSKEQDAQGSNFIIVPVTPQDPKPEDMDEHLSDNELPNGSANAEYVCEECGKLFTHLSSKKRHMLKHKGEIPPVVYQCLACSKTFQYNSSLKRHLKLHSEEVNGKAYTCKVCSKAFMYATSLKRHLKTHSGKEIFPCPHCHRCFEYISSLKRHEKLHSEGKGFKCESCLKSFGYLSSLTRHQKTHQKCLSCDKCDKQFRFHKSYVKHLEEHNTNSGSNDYIDKAGSMCPKEDSGMDVDESEETGNDTLEGTESTGSNDEAKGVNENGSLKETTLHGEVIDLQSVENHPFVKFVVSQNTLNIEEIQSYHAAQASQSSASAGNQVATSTNVTFAVVQSDDGAVVENMTMVAEDGQAYPEGIVFVELDQNNKVTERHMEGLQASNLLQLLQAVEGFAVEQTVTLEEQQQEVDENLVAVKEIQQENEEPHATE